MTWRVTHLDHHHRRHVLVLQDCTAAQASALAQALYGDALYLATIRMRGGQR